MVGRRKNKQDAWLPPRVYRGRSRYEYRPKDGSAVKLCKLPVDGIESEAVKAAVWQAVAAVKSAPPEYDDVNKMIDAFHASDQFSQRSARTQEDYRRYSKAVSRVFGKALPHQVKPFHIRQFMDAMAEHKNKAGESMYVTANRHHSYLSVLFGYGLQYNWCDTNPAKGVRKFRESPRDRYAEDWEYEIVLRSARATAYTYIAPMMELGYLCRGRPHCEVRLLTEFDVDDSGDGIFLEREKGSINEITGWSDRLRAAVKEARSLNPDAPTNVKRPLIHGRQGDFIPADSVKTGWSRVMKKAITEGCELPDHLVAQAAKQAARIEGNRVWLKDPFTMQDIKAKGVTDHAKKESGHKTKKMQAVYDRKPGVVAPTK